MGVDQYLNGQIVDHIGPPFSVIMKSIISPLRVAKLYYYLSLAS